MWVCLYKACIISADRMWTVLLCPPGQTINSQARCKRTSTSKVLYQHACAQGHEHRWSIFYREERVLAGLHTDKSSILHKSVFLPWEPETTNAALSKLFARTHLLLMNLPFSLPAIAGYFFSIWLFSRSDLRNPLVWAALLQHSDNSLIITTNWWNKQWLAKLQLPLHRQFSQTAAESILWYPKTTHSSIQIHCGGSSRCLRSPGSSITDAPTDSET